MVSKASVMSADTALSYGQFSSHISFRQIFVQIEMSDVFHVKSAEAIFPLTPKDTNEICILSSVQKSEDSKQGLDDLDFLIQRAYGMVATKAKVRVF